MRRRRCCGRSCWHLDVHIPYAATTLLWAVVLAAVFWFWQRIQGTLSIHSITSQRREAFYWATVFATFEPELEVD